MYSKHITFYFQIKKPIKNYKSGGKTVSFKIELEIKCNKLLCF